MKSFGRADYLKRVELRCGTRSICSAVCVIAEKQMRSHVGTGGDVTAAESLRRYVFDASAGRRPVSVIPAV